MQTITKTSNKETAASGSSKKISHVPSFFLAVIFFVVFNIVVGLALHTHRQTIDEDFASTKLFSEVNMAHSWPWWIAKDYLSQASTPDVVLLGSSQMATATFTADANTQQVALDCVVDRRATTLEKYLLDKTGKHVTIFNTAVGGGMVSDAYMIGRILLTGKHQPKMVIIGVGPRDFMDNTLASASATEPFRFYSQYLDAGQIPPYSYPDDFARLDQQMNKLIPLYRMRLQVQKRLGLTQSESQEKQTGHQFLKGIFSQGDQVKPGEWKIPANIPYLFEDNTKEYLHRYANCNPPIYASELLFFQDFLKLMHDRQIKVLVVGMPSLPPNRSLLPATFWTIWRANVKGAAKQYGYNFVDLTDSPAFALDDYLDTVHLAASGGKKFFATVSDTIATTPDLLNALPVGSNGDTSASKVSDNGTSR
jgi:hypothetical protein